MDNNILRYYLWEPYQFMFGSGQPLQFNYVSVLVEEIGDTIAVDVTAEAGDRVEIVRVNETTVSIRVSRAREGVNDE